MLAAVPGRHRITVGGDKGFDTAGFVAAMRELKVTPHVAQNTSQPPLGDRRPDHPPSRLRGQPAHPQADRGGVRLDQGDRPAAPCPAPRQGRVGWQFTLAAAAYNLIRLPKLLAA